MSGEASGASAGEGECAGETAGDGGVDGDAAAAETSDHDAGTAPTSGNLTTKVAPPRAATGCGSAGRTAATVIMAVTVAASTERGSRMFTGTKAPKIV